MDLAGVHNSTEGSANGAARATRLSIIVPCFNEEPVIRETNCRLLATAEQSGMDFELLYVDDGSADGTADTVIMQGVEDQTTRKPSVVRKAAVTFNRLRGDALSRGQSRDLIRKIAEELWKTT